MIPGPITLSPGVLAAAAEAPPSHVSGPFITAFGRSLAAMRQIWRAPSDAQPFLLAGSGTLAMEVAVWNTLEPEKRALVVNTGHFSDRLVTMLRRRGVEVLTHTAPLGRTVSATDISEVLQHARTDAVCITHVDTSTGVRVDVAGIAKVAKAAGKLVLVDGVCATGGETLDMADSGVDVYLTASQKAHPDWRCWWPRPMPSPPVSVCVIRRPSGWISSPGRRSWLPMKPESPPISPLPRPRWLTPWMWPFRNCWPFKKAA